MARGIMKKVDPPRKSGRPIDTPLSRAQPPAFPDFSDLRFLQPAQSGMTIHVDP
jgi:hypothetical protein